MRHTNSRSIRLNWSETHKKFYDLFVRTFCLARRNRVIEFGWRRRCMFCCVPILHYIPRKELEISPSILANFGFSHSVSHNDQFHFNQSKTFNPIDWFVGFFLLLVPIPMKFWCYKMSMVQNSPALLIGFEINNNIFFFFSRPNSLALKLNTRCTLGVVFFFVCLSMAWTQWSQIWNEWKQMTRRHLFKSLFQSYTALRYEMCETRPWYSPILRL